MPCSSADRSDVVPWGAFARKRTRGRVLRKIVLKWIFLKFSCGFASPMAASLRAYFTNSWQRDDLRERQQQLAADGPSAARNAARPEHALQRQARSMPLTVQFTPTGGEITQILRHEHDHQPNQLGS
jgi:hypothetical protein